jgi:hypothetical protein
VDRAGFNKHIQPADEFKFIHLLFDYTGTGMILDAIWRCVGVYFLMS